MLLLRHNTLLGPKVEQDEAKNDMGSQLDLVKGGNTASFSHLVFFEEI